MDLSTAADVAQIVGLATIVVGGGVALLQQRNFHRQRMDAASFEFLQLWTPENMEDLGLVYALEEPVDPAALDADEVRRRAANHIVTVMEKMGILVHARRIPLADLDAWAGNATRLCWRKLQPWVEAKRRTAGSERPGEWFQWLAEQLASYAGTDPAVGAHTLYRDWKP